MQEAHQKPTTAVITQARLSKTASCMELAESQQAQEALDYILESHDPPPTECEEAALILILMLHSWNWNYNVTLGNKMSPPYARTAKGRPTTASVGEVHLHWTPGRGNEEYTMAHTVHDGNIPTEAEDPEQTKTQPPRHTPQQWTLYKVLAHACTLAEHSIQPYTDVKYVERMLQDRLRYETEVLEGYTERPETTPPTRWNDLVPNGDIFVLAKITQNKAPTHSFDDNDDPAIVNAILAYHS